MKPRWMRNHWSCPDCGKIFTTDEISDIMRRGTIKWVGMIPKQGPEKAFDCPACKAHWPAEDFHNFQAEKWGHLPSEEELEVQEAKLEEFMADKQPDWKEQEET
jgi:hypothetical protein